MEGGVHNDRGRTSSVSARRGDRRFSRADVTPALVLAAFVFFACADPPHPLEARCLEALAYRSPGHGEVESMERTPTEAGTAVSIRYAVEDPPEGPHHRYVVCEFAEGDRWALNQMIFEGQVLPEPELALVNSDLLLQDLTENPERFEERKHLVPKPPPVVPSTPVASSEAGSVPAAPPAHSGSDPVAARSVGRTNAEATNATTASPPGRVGMHSRQRSVDSRSAVPGTPHANPADATSPVARASNGFQPNPSPPAAPMPTPVAPTAQMPAPSSGGSD